MHKEKVLGMCNIKGFSYQEHKRNLFFEKFSWMLFLKNISNANLLYVFYRVLIESIFM
jgi:hypothetical protein